MRTKKLFLISILLLGCMGKAHAQWVVSDALGYVKDFFNTTLEVGEAMKTVKNTYDGFNEVAKLYDENKKYIDKLKKVNNLIGQAKKVRDSAILVSDIMGIYRTNFALMQRDPNFSTQELTAISSVFTGILTKSTSELSGMSSLIKVSGNGYSMTDKERMDAVDKVYDSLLKFRDLASRFSAQNIALSRYRAKDSAGKELVNKLYNEKYRVW